MGTFFTNPQGRPDDIGNRTIRRRVVLGQNRLTTGVPIGAFEKGSVILRAYVIVNTAFNAGTTNVLVLGDPTTDNTLITTANAVAGTTGMKSGTGTAVGTELAVDTIFYAKFTQTGTAATTGDATFIVEASPPYPWSDLVGTQQP